MYDDVTYVYDDVTCVPVVLEDVCDSFGEVYLGKRDLLMSAKALVLVSKRDLLMSKRGLL